MITVTTFENTTLRRRVAAGARLLDGKIPGWYMLINTDKLNLSSPETWVLAQVTDANYNQIAWTWELSPSDLDGASGAVSNGFVAPDGLSLRSVDRYYDQLKPYWVAEIQSRLSPHNKYDPKQITQKEQ